MARLETCEWSDIWWEHASNGNTPRIMIVGDSITVGYRSYVNSIFDGKIYADAYSTSKSIDNPFYTEEMDLIMKQSKKSYDLIHFNCGLHGFHLSAKEYAAHYESVIKHITEVYPSTKLALALSTPITKTNSRKRLDEEKNPIVEARNKIVLEISQSYKLAVNDLYSPMLNKPHLRKNDGYHYKSKGCCYQARLVADFILKELQK